MNSDEEVKAIFQKQIQNFVDKEIRPFVLEWEESGRTPREIWKRAGELGLLGIPYASEYGGQELNFDFTKIFCEEIAKCGSSGVALGLIVQAHMSTPALAAHGSKALKEKYLKPAISGEFLSSIAVTEPDCGSDVAHLKTKATLKGNHYLLSGAKMFITNGTQADFFTVLARTSDQPGYRSFSLFIVPADLPGVQRGRTLKKTCYLSSDTSEILFKDVKVPKDHLIGKEGLGFQYQMEQFQHERLGAAFMMLGTMKRTYQLTKAYVQERKVFGRKLSDHQVTRHKLAQIASEIECIDAFCNRCAETANQGKDLTKEVSMLKLVAAQTQMRVLEECVQLHGGYGLMTEYEVARYYRDSKLATIGGGSNEIMKEIISKIEEY